MERRIIFILLVILAIIALAFVAGYAENFFSGEAIYESKLSNYSYTKAICNSKNNCIDVLIECKDGKVTYIEPLSDIVKLHENWKDDREDKELCG